MTPSKNPTRLRDVLYAMSLAKPVPDAEVLDDFIRRYPEHANALTDFAIELAMDAVGSEAESPDTPDETANAVSPAVSRAMSRFQNRLYAVQRDLAHDLEKRSETASIKNPFAALSRSDFRSLAQRLNANSVFVSKLRDRLIDPNTMTDGFRQHVADELEVPIDVIVAHFAAQPQIQAGLQHFKSDQKPEAGAKQSFKEAVQNSGLTHDQQRYLLSL